MKTDARVRYTKMRIREAFFQCLREKPVNRITVKELCEIAEINRATFYTHYNDPFDLLEKLEEEKLAELRERIAKQREDGENMLLTVLQGMQAPSGETALLASQNGDPGFAAKLSQLYQESFIPSIAEKRPELDPETQSYLYRFLAGGCGSVLSAWLDSGMVTPTEELATIMDRFCKSLLNKC